MLLEYIASLISLTRVTSLNIFAGLSRLHRIARPRIVSDLLQRSASATAARHFTDASGYVRLHGRASR